MALGDLVGTGYAVVSGGSWGATSLTISPAATAGNLLVCFISRNDDGTGVTPVAPSEGGFTIQQQGNYSGSASLNGALMWKKATGGETAITPSWSDTSQAGQMVYVELDATGLDLDTIGDSSEDETETSAATHGAGTVTNATAVALAICAFAIDNVTGGRTITNYSDGFSEVATGNTGSANATVFLGKKVLSSIGSHACVATLSASDQAYGAQILFNASADATDFPDLQRTSRGVGAANAARLGGVLQRSFARVQSFFLPDRRLIVAHGA